MPNRLISDNGWLNHTLMTALRASKSTIPQVAVLLDAEKAYGRVHPGHLQQVLTRFGFPPQLLHCLSFLFFDTQIRITVNGWQSAPVPQARGLRQGDPLSPLLFNLANEPLLRYLLASPAFQGIEVPRSNPTIRQQCSSLELNTRIIESPPVRLLAYADDLEALSIYSRASNARTNISKTTIVPLSGTPSTTWLDICHTSGIERHYLSSSKAVTLLGYPLYSSDRQLTRFLSDVRAKLFKIIHHIRMRGLSVRGLSVVVNSLVLNRLWFLLRVIVLPQDWIASIRTAVYDLALPFWPKPSRKAVNLPRLQGGLSIVDIDDQSLALQLVYIRRLDQHGSGFFSAGPDGPQSVQAFLQNMSTNATDSQAHRSSTSSGAECLLACGMAPGPASTNGDHQASDCESAPPSDPSQLPCVR
ncbi:Transposon TX1 uncharacterized protein, partial [Choanephora cucurbitarum]